MIKRIKDLKPKDLEYPEKQFLKDFDRLVEELKKYIIKQQKCK